MADSLEDFLFGGLVCDIQEDTIGGGVEVCKAREKKTCRDGGVGVRCEVEVVPDIRYRGEESLGAKRKGFVAPEGKFIEKPHEKYSRRRGRGVCEACRGACCAGLRELVGGLMDSGEYHQIVRYVSVGGILVVMS